MISPNRAVPDGERFIGMWNTHITKHLFVLETRLVYWL